MALPPDPIEEVLPGASSAVMAEVTRVLHKGQTSPSPHGEPGKTSAVEEAPKQVVELRVDEVLFGAAETGRLVTVVKPPGAYALVAGNKGPFLLRAVKDGEAVAVILGRYGPDTYSRRYIEDTAKKLGKR